MPTITPHRATELARGTNQVAVGKIPLYLPSAVPPSVSCDTRLMEMEWELRQAQCYDVLDDVRDGLRLKSFLILNKKRNTTGQAAQTRSATLILRADARIKSSVDCYVKARQCLLRLSEQLNKAFPSERLQEIRPEHLTMLPVDDLPLLGRFSKRTRAGDPTEGHRQVSWIWMELGGVRLDLDAGRYHDSELYSVILLYILTNHL